MKDEKTTKQQKINKQQQQQQNENENNIPDKFDTAVWQGFHVLHIYVVLGMLWWYIVNHRGHTDTGSYDASPKQVYMNYM